jgi:hypothetical protein
MKTMDAPQLIDFGPPERGSPSEPRLIHAVGRLDHDEARNGERRTGGQSGAPYALDVRAVRPTDLFGLLRPPDVVLLDEPRVADRSYAPVRAAMAAMTPGRGRPRFFIARSNGNLVGFAHFQQVGSDRRWLAIAMGAATGVYQAGPAWEELLRHVTVAAGLRGVKRLFAKAPSGMPFLESFDRANYSAYATETIFVSNHPVFGASEAVVRRQEPPDAWAVHQLYNAATPKQVQYAEAWTSERWAVKPARAGERVNAWILEEGHLIIGSVRVTSVGCDHRVELLYHPDRPSAAKELIVVALAKLRKATKIGRIYCAVRGYQAEGATALEDHGFEPVMEQDLLIKYTTAVARVPQSEGTPFPAELIERLPKRAPSFPIGASVGEQSN